MITSLASSKLTGALPAISGASLTGITSGPTISAVDPAINTNPSAVGAAWVNRTSGSVFVCTDATAGANLWHNVGNNFGLATNAFGGNGLGKTHAFTSGGYKVGDKYNIIDRFSIPSAAICVDHGDLVIGSASCAGSSSLTHGYCSGGSINDPAPYAGVCKFGFASGSSSSVVATLNLGRYGPAGATSATKGYVFGGVSSVGNTNEIQSFLLSNETTLADQGDLTVARRLSGCGHSSSTHGFASTVGDGNSNIIDRFSFYNNSGAADHGDLHTSRGFAAATSSQTHGYVAGGSPSGSHIDKFSFISNTTGTSVGSLTQGARINLAGHSAQGYGYVAGSQTPNTAHIERWSTESDNDAVDCADLTQARGHVVGQQV